MKTSLCFLGLATLGLASLFACGEQECLPTKKLGSCCSDSTDCDAPFTCVSQLRNGICTQDCTDAEKTCPKESVCMGVRYTGSQTVDGFWCLLKCGEGLNTCRSDQNCVKVVKNGQTYQFCL